MPDGLAVTVEEFPAQMVEGKAEAVTIGRAFTVTEVEAEAEVHPLASSTVTE